MSLPIAIQLYSLRDDMERDFPGTLKKVAALGYNGVEFAGLFGYAPGEIKKLLSELSLVPISAHVSLDDMLAGMDELFAAYETIGCRFIVVPYMPEGRRPGEAHFAQTLADIRALGACAKKHGMQLLYHNHDFEFVRLDGAYGLDVLYQSVDASLLETEIDTCWVHVAGVDPADYVRKYTGRAPVVHLKDFVMKGKKPANLYKLIGIDDDAAQASEETFGFRPVGYGAQDMPAILKASQDAGAGWVVVEQDEPALNKTPLECAKMSIDYLRSFAW